MCAVVGGVLGQEIVKVCCTVPSIFWLLAGSLATKCMTICYSGRFACGRSSHDVTHAI